MQHEFTEPMQAAGYRRLAMALAVASALAAAGSANAFEIDINNPDVAMRWDNTVRLNAGMRVQDQDPALLKNPNLDDGDRNFGRGTPVTERTDLLSEFDFVWRRELGFRTSGAAWWDAAYTRHLGDTSTATANTLVDGRPAAGQLSDFTKRYARGGSGEILDAFTFANFELAGVPFNLKAGQHTVYWGESLLLGGAVHGISYSQNALDINKGLSTPGTEAKELFRPRGGVTLQAQPRPDLSLAGQWFYNWQAARIPESGSYLSINDSLEYGADSAIVAANPFFGRVPGAPAYLRAWNVSGPWSRTASDLDDWGLSARWSPAWFDGTLGAYYRNANDTVPQQIVTPGVATGLPAATCRAIGGIVIAPGVCLVNQAATSPAALTQLGKYGTYQFAYGKNIHITGLTFSKEIAGIALGGEVSYRQNMPLVSDAVIALPAPLVHTVPGAIAVTSIPSTGTPGALGNTMHGLLNAIDVLPKTPFFDTATVQTELTWMHWLAVTQNDAVFRGRPGYTALDRVTKEFYGLAVNFTPTWFQVLPGADLLAPFSWAGGLSGNSAVQLGGNQNAGTYSGGLALDIRQKYRFDLKYTGYYGEYSKNPTTGAATVTDGAYAALSDRGWVSLTFKTTF